MGNNVTTRDGVITRQEAKRQGLSIDIGHKPDYEFWKTRNAAEYLGWTQDQYNAFMNRPDGDMFRYEEHNFNISHEGESKTGDWDRALQDMIKYQEEQEAAGEWKRRDDEEKKSDCKSD